MEGARQKLNGETIAGISLVFLASLFIFAGMMNPIWAIILPADYLILAIGIGFIAIGVRATARANRTTPHAERSGRY